MPTPVTTTSTTIHPTHIHFLRPPHRVHAQARRCRTTSSSCCHCSTLSCQRSSEAPPSTSLRFSSDCRCRLEGPRRLCEMRCAFVSCCIVGQHFKRCALHARAHTHTHTRTHTYTHTHTHTHTQDSKGTTDHGPVHVATQERRGADGPSSQAPHRHTLRSLTSAASCVRLDGDRIQENSPLQRWCGGGCQRGGERKQRWPRDGDRCTSTLRANQLGKLRWTVRSTSLYSFTPFWFMRRALRERVGCGFMSEPSTLFHP
jgi:hypothetical protein